MKNDDIKYRQGRSKEQESNEKIMLIQLVD